MPGVNRICKQKMSFQPGKVELFLRMSVALRKIRFYGWRLLSWRRVGHWPLAHRVRLVSVGGTVGNPDMPKGRPIRIEDPQRRPGSPAPDHLLQAQQG
jgi:hypothetical protein